MSTSVLLNHKVVAFNVALDALSMAEYWKLTEQSLFLKSFDSEDASIAERTGHGGNAVSPFRNP